MHEEGRHEFALPECSPSKEETPSQVCSGPILNKRRKSSALDAAETLSSITDNILITDLNEIIKHINERSVAFLFISRENCPIPQLLEPLPFLCHVNRIKLFLLPSNFHESLSDCVDHSSLFIFSVRREHCSQALLAFLDGIYQAKFPQFNANATRFAEPLIHPSSSKNIPIQPNKGRTP